MDYTVDLQCELVRRLRRQETDARKNYALHFVGPPRPGDEPTRYIAMLDEPAGELYPPDMQTSDQFWYECTITNYGRDLVSGFRLDVEFAWKYAVRTNDSVIVGRDYANGGFAISKFAVAATQNQTAVAYLYNGGSNYVEVKLPETVLIRRVGSSDYERVKLVSSGEGTDVALLLPPSSIRELLKSDPKSVVHPTNP